MSTLAGHYANKFTITRHTDGTLRIVFLDERGDMTAFEAACLVMTTGNADALAKTLVDVLTQGAPQ